MYQNMLRNQMTPLGWTLNLELGTGQLGRCWCWAPKILVTGYWADVELLKRSFSRRNWSPSVSCGRFSAPTVTLTWPDQHHSHFHPHLSLFFDIFYCCYAIVGSTNFGWVKVLPRFSVLYCSISKPPSSTILHPALFIFLNSLPLSRMQWLKFKEPTPPCSLDRPRIVHKSLPLVVVE